MPRIILYPLIFGAILLFQIVFGEQGYDNSPGGTLWLRLINAAFYTGLIAIGIIQYDKWQHKKQVAREAEAREKERVRAAAEEKRQEAERNRQQEKERARQQTAENQRKSEGERQKKEWDEWASRTGYAKYYGGFITRKDGTRHSKTNIEHYAKTREIDTALGGRYIDNVDDFLRKRAQGLILDEAAHSDDEWQKIYDDLIVPYCPAGYLYVGGGFYTDMQGHALSVGGTRSGKGTCIVAPTLLNPLNRIQSPKTPSYVVLDPKGENLAIAGNYLKRAGYHVIVINPFDIPQIAAFGSHGFNIFDTFSADQEDFGEFLDMITYGLVPISNGGDSFWQDSGRNIIRLYIRHMMTQNEEPRNFKTLYKWLLLADDQRVALLRKMVVNDAFDGDVSSRALSIMGQLNGGASKMVEGYYAQLQIAIEFLSDRQMTKWLSQNDFDLTQIASEKTALFLCLEPKKLKTMQPFMRIVIGAVMRSLFRHYSPTRKVIMIMDEFIQMGRLEEFEVFANFGSGIGAGVTLWPIVQSLQDLERTYPDSWQTFINNSFIRHFVKITDNMTAEYLHKRLPIVERVKDDIQIPEEPTREDVRKRSGAFLTEESINDLYSEAIKHHADLVKFKISQRKYSNEPLLTVNEILNLDQIIVEINGCKDYALFTKSPYYEHPNLGRDEADPNPFRR